MLAVQKKSWQRDMVAAEDRASDSPSLDQARAIPTTAPNTVARLCFEARTYSEWTGPEVHGAIKGGS